MFGLGLTGFVLLGAGEFTSVATPDPTISAVAAVQPTAPLEFTELDLNDDVTLPERPARLSMLVAEMSGATLPPTYADAKCLARAVYFESRGEPLEGQLAVAQVILNRVASGRYARTVCAVVEQPGQFSFAHERSPRAGNDWRIAQAIARIALGDHWEPMAPRAIAFHAARVSPSWGRMERVNRIGNHIFYR